MKPNQLNQLLKMNYLLKLRYHINDNFSEVRKYIAPTHYHDRCERLVQPYFVDAYVFFLSNLITAFVLLCFVSERAIVAIT